MGSSMARILLSSMPWPPLRYRRSEAWYGVVGTERIPFDPVGKPRYNDGTGGS